MDPTCPSECIYNLIPSDLKEPPQPPRYISIFKATVKDDMQKAKTAMKTMGPAKVEVPSPKDFLKKHSKEKTLPPIKKFDRNMPKKPAVPLRTDHPVMGIQSGKNFINTNAADVIMGVAKKPKPIYVDKRTGDKHDVESSGLVPKYINKKDPEKSKHCLSLDQTGKDTASHPLILKASIQKWQRSPPLTLSNSGHMATSYFMRTTQESVVLPSVQKENRMFVRILMTTILPNCCFFSEFLPDLLVYLK
uniref:Enkurin, TRPC channel interacting protein n=1 Tax=Papio anubis TaxID=9555 RepID=A0A8I5N5G5_PAPAN